MSLSLALSDGARAPPGPPEAKVAAITELRVARTSAVADVWGADFRWALQERVCAFADCAAPDRCHEALILVNGHGALLAFHASCANAYVAQLDQAKADRFEWDEHLPAADREALLGHVQLNALLGEWAAFQPRAFLPGCAYPSRRTDPSAVVYLHDEQAPAPTALHLEPFFRFETSSQRSTGVPFPPLPDRLALPQLRLDGRVFHSEVYVHEWLIGSRQFRVVWGRVELDQQARFLQALAQISVPLVALAQPDGSELLRFRQRLQQAVTAVAELPSLAPSVSSVNHDAPGSLAVLQRCQPWNHGEVFCIVSPPYRVEAFALAEPAHHVNLNATRTEIDHAVAAGAWTRQPHLEGAVPTLRVFSSRRQ